MTTTEPTPSAPLDRDAIRERYRAERDKRLRADGNDQYIEVTGRFAHFVDDPYVEPVEREPLFDEVTAIFIGGGFGGLVTGARLAEQGIQVRIVEKGGDFGGTWYWNRYPGAQCDTHSFVYMPLLEETGHVPTEKYAHGPEILEHSRRIGTHFGLYDEAIFQTEVTELEWDDGTARWIVRTNRGDEMRARFVLMCTGPLHRPKLPGIPGIETFGGHAFHTSRWDYAYTGGDPDGGVMTGLADKRVGIIGTGATSVQCIPHLARAARELYVFQRTPSSIDVRNNAPTDMEWFEDEVLEPGWQDRWLRNFTAHFAPGTVPDEDLVGDGWTDLARRISDRMFQLFTSNDGTEVTVERMMEAFFDADDEKMNEIRARVDELVGDADTATALKPWFRQLCKRPCFHDEYLQAFNNPNVTLLDTDGQGVERIDETGVWVDGVHHELDCLIYATGFEVGTSFTRRSGFDAVGRDGVRLSEHWESSMRTMHGMHVHGFPNLFHVGAAQGAGLIANYPHNLTEAGAHVAHLIRRLLDDGIEAVEATAQAEEDWLTVLRGDGNRMSGMVLGSTECTPGYYNNEGKGFDDGFVGPGYPGGALAFFDLMARWRDTGDLEGLDIR